MVYKNSKNSKKKINDLKPVIKTSYKKVNRKQNTKKIGGYSWAQFKESVSITTGKAKEFGGTAKEGIIKSVGRYKGKGVKVGDKIEFISRHNRGLSKYPIGFNYRSGKQIENRMHYMTMRINEKRQIYTKVNGKLAGRQSKFRSMVNDKYEKLAIEMEQESARLKGELTKGKITKEQFEAKILNIEKKKDKTIAEIEQAKKNFLNRNKDLIKKVEEKKKDLIKISDKYKPDIEKLTLKLRTKVRKATKLLDSGLRKTCKKLPKSENCFVALEACRAKPEIIGKAKIIGCMSEQGFKDPKFAANLDRNILRTINPFREKKIRARSKRIDRLEETMEIKNQSQIVLKDTQKLKDLKEVQNSIKPLKTSEIYSDTVNRTKGNLQKIQQREIQNMTTLEEKKLIKGFEKTAANSEVKFQQKRALLKTTQNAENQAAQQLIQKTKLERNQAIKAAESETQLAKGTVEQEAQVAREAVQQEAQVARQATVRDKPNPVYNPDAERIAAEKAARAERTATVRERPNPVYNPDAERIAAEKAARAEIAAI